jgi:hypothetical protein
MSYYTGFNELDLAPLRLLIAARSEAIADSELRDMLKREIRLVAKKRSDLRSGIQNAYSGAPPQGRRLIEEMLQEEDPSFLATIRKDRGQPRDYR